MQTKIVSEITLRALEKTINAFIKDKKYAQVSLGIQELKSQWSNEYIAVIVYEP